MSGFAFSAPLGLLALLGIPLVVLYHMRDNVPDRKPIPTLRFWRAAIDPRSERVKFRRPPLTWLLVVQLLVVLLTALALARPTVTNAWGGIGDRVQPQHLILLLDGSTSMSAVDTESGASRFETARADAANLIGELREGDVATAIVLGSHPRTYQAGSRAELLSLEERIDSLEQPGGQAELNAALRLARELILPEMDNRIVVLSDAALSADPALVSTIGAKIELRETGSPETGNVAIVELTARESLDTPGTQQIYARAINFSSEPQTGIFSVLADDIQIASEEVTIEPGADLERIIGAIPANTGTVTVDFAKADALTADNSASLIVSRDARLGLRVLPVTDTPGALQRALSVLPGVELTTVPTVDTTVTASSYDVVVYEGFTPPATTLPNVPMFIAGPPLTSELFQSDGVMSAPELSSFRADDPLLIGVDLAGVTFGETPVHRLGSDTTAVITATGGPLLYRTTTPGGQPMIVMTFNLDQSNLSKRVAFPILMSNVIGQLAPNPLPSSVQVGEPLVYLPRPESTAVRITAPNGSSTELPVTTDGAAANPVSFADTGQPGIYQIEEIGDLQRAGSVYVNAGHAQESDLRANPNLADLLATAKPSQAAGGSASRFDLWPWIVAATIALLAIEWGLSLFRRHSGMDEPLAPARSPS
jgi:hypothetical protein